MDNRGMKPMFRSLAPLVFLLLFGLAAGPSRPAGAAKEDCRPDGEAHAFQCMWDQQDFQGNMKAVTPADLAGGQCMDYSIRSAANTGKSGLYTLYLFEEANCGGSAVSKLNAGESVRSLTAKSARLAQKDSYR
jgi:peptidase inhibitor family I36